MSQRSRNVTTAAPCAILGTRRRRHEEVSRWTIRTDAASHPEGVVSAELALGLATLVSVAAYLGYRQLMGDPGPDELQQRLDALYRQVVAWQAAHDHQVASLDRRMRDVETAAARAEEEARIVSVQMAELTQGLCRRLEQVEQRNEIDRLASERRLPY